ncbi:MAG: transporter related [Actinomycetia bacterium]|nr:transporter related [Actinomycetes bacterium]
MTAPALELIDVHAGYGRIDVLHGVNLSIPRGRAMALLGPNGAGKSTTVQVAGGRLVPTSGCLHVAGNHVNGAAPGELAQAGVCTVPEGRGIFPNLTVDENLWVMTHVARAERAEVRERAFRHFPRLAGRRTQLAGTLSGGEQQMLAMSRALVAEPSVLILDEVSMGLAPLIVRELYENVARLKELGIAMLIVEQFAETALAVADFAAIMAHGRIQAVGLPDEIAGELAGAYLGGVA